MTTLGDVDAPLGRLASALFPGDGTPPTTWRLHDVQWTPGRVCRLAYLASGPQGEPTFIDVDINPSGSSWRDYRADAALPGLTTATNPEAVARALGPALGERVIGCAVDPVRYRPGQRCVLRYDVRTPTRRVRCYAKVLTPQDFVAAAPVVSALSARWAVGLAPADATVPRLVRLWPEASAIVVEGMAGLSVTTELWDTSTSDPERDRVAAAVGAALAHFHAQTHVPAPRWSPAQQLDALEQSLVAVRHADPGVADRLRTLTHRLASAAPPDEEVVLGHGAFRTGQLLIDAAGRLTVLDVEGACHSNAARDLGSVLAHLAWQGLRRPDRQAAATRVGTALLDAYERRAARLAPRTLAWWRAAALLQVGARRFRRLETQDWATVPALLDAAEDLVGAARPGPSVPARSRLLDAGHMTGVLNEVFSQEPAPQSAAPAPAVSVVSATELAAAPGRRTVVRYRVRGLDGAAESVIVGKAFVERRRADLLHRQLRLLAPLGPEPLGHVPDLGLVLYRHREGTPLDRVTDPTTRHDGVRAAARWLAALHSAPVVLPRALQLEDEADTARTWAALVASAHPDLAGPALTIADGWLPRELSSPVPRVPLHKDFHPGHVLVGDRVHVVDLDEARQGDPAFDLAHFRAYAALLGDGTSLATAFLQEYAAVTGWEDQGTLRSFEAYAWLKIARQWVTGAALFRGAPSARRREGTEQALAKGVACLPA